ncbi:MAG: zinc-dependent alcohol dehydrogenase [Hyphomicrobiaceae bacterium]
MKPSTSLWYEAQQKLSLRTEMLCPAGDHDVVLDALFSGVSRGTERLVFFGKIPESEWRRMQCPNQDGSFPFPVKYGYGFVGRIAVGSGRKAGNPVFCLHPHQSCAVVAADAPVPLPDGVPARRGILAANMETAINVVWDSQASVGDRVLVVGAGVVGLLIGYVMSRIAGVEVTLCDTNAGRRVVAEALDLAFCAPDSAPKGCDVTVNASASAGGLETAVSAAGPEARVIEASWYGDAEVRVPLGGAFHSQRLQLISSQVGRLPAKRQARWTHRRRLELAVSLLDDPALDHLITHEIDFDAAPDQLPPLFDDPSVLAIALRYPPSGE